MLVVQRHAAHERFEVSLVEVLHAVVGGGGLSAVVRLVAAVVVSMKLSRGRSPTLRETRQRQGRGVGPGYDAKACGGDGDGCAREHLVWVGMG